MEIHDTFELMLDPRWKVTESGAGSVIRRPRSVHLSLTPGGEIGQYHNAQITEYDPEKRDFQCAPPLKLTVRAWSSLHPSNLQGTAGFGFWNHPFEPGKRGFSRPQALWFLFAASPNDMPLAKDVPGQGWKAAVFDAKRWQFLLLTPFAPVGFLLMRVKALYEALWGIGQRAIGVSEALLDSNLLNGEQEYVIEWRENSAIFRINGDIVHQTDSVPSGHLGFIAWMDNQYRVVTPQGHFSGGVSEVKRPQALVIQEIKIEPLS